MLSDTIKHLLLTHRNDTISLTYSATQLPHQPQSRGTVTAAAPQLCFLKEEEKDQECERTEFLLVERQQKQDCAVCEFRRII